MKYRIKFPQGKCNVHALSKIEAIKAGWEIYKERMQHMIDSGMLESVPEACSTAKRRNVMEELGNEMPIKPSRMRKGLKRMK